MINILILLISIIWAFLTAGSEKNISEKTDPADTTASTSEVTAEDNRNSGKEEIEYELVEVNPSCGPAIGFSFKLPKGWIWEGEQTDDEPTSSLCVDLWFFDSDPTIRIRIDYSMDGYSIDTTEFKEKKIKFNGYPAVKGFYDGSDEWSYIRLTGEYEGCVVWNDDSIPSEYADTVDFILSSIRFKHYE